MPQRVPPALVAATQRALDEMMEGFRRIDASQRMAAGMVDKFVAYLPERAATSGLVPRFRMLDARADELIDGYLSALDHHPFAEDIDPHHMTAAQHKYLEIGPRLLTHAASLQQFLDDWDVEFSRIGREVSRARDLRESARAALERALLAAGGLADAGHQVPEVDDLVEQARSSGRAIGTWRPGSSLEELARHGVRIAELADAVESIASGWPARVDRATRRRRSLATVVQTVESRLVRVSEALATLRRDYSVGNWDDLDGAERDVGAGLVVVRGRLAEFDRMVAQGAPWTGPLELLEKIRGELDDIEAVVDAPRARLAELAEVRADPDGRVGRVRFAVRDAQQLVAHSSVGGTAAIAQALDRLAVQADGLTPMLVGANPDYWSMLSAARRIEAGVREQVDRYRALARR